MSKQTALGGAREKCRGEPILGGGAGGGDAAAP